jgi:putative membrane protein
MFPFRPAVLAAAALFALLPATISLAANPAAAGKDGAKAAAAKQSPGEIFVRKSQVANLFEIEAAQLAVERARDGNVRQFAEQMIKDRRAAAEKLQVAAGRSDITLSAAKLDDAHRQKMEKLRNAGAAEFDRTYMKMQIESHQQALKLHQDYARAGELPALKETAGDLARTIERHLTRAREVETMIS